MESIIVSFLWSVLPSAWDVVGFHRSLLSTVFFFGMFCGALFWGYLSDKFGRRRMFLSVTLVQLIFGLFTSVAMSLNQLVALRFFVGLAVGGMNIILLSNTIYYIKEMKCKLKCFIGSLPIDTSMFMEFVPTSKRSLYTILLTNFWSLGAVFEAFLAWMLIPNLGGIGWRIFIALSALPNIVLIFFRKGFLESPYFLCLSGHEQQAKEVLTWIEKENGTNNLPSEFILVATATDKTSPSPLSSSGNISTQKGSFILLLSSPTYKTTLALWFIWFSNSLVYYGVVVALPPYLMLKGFNNPYLVVLIIAACEIPGTVASAYMNSKFGRRKIMCLSYIGVAVLLGVASIPDTPWLLLLFVFALSKMLFSLASSTTYTITRILMHSFLFYKKYLLWQQAELYPTSIRSIGMGTCGSIARLGGVSAPFISEVFLGTSFPEGVFAVFCCICLLSASCVYILRETEGQPLSDFIAKVFIIILLILLAHKTNFVYIRILKME